MIVICEAQKTQKAAEKLSVLLDTISQSSKL